LTLQTSVSKREMPRSGHGGEVFTGLRAARLPARHQANRSLTTDLKREGAVLLTPRQAEVLHWIAEGKTNTEIATILGCSVETVKNHVKQIFQRLGVHTRTAAAAYAYRQLIAEAERLRASVQ
jgi:DNA-binding CsgD family transcriptional regulator